MIEQETNCFQITREPEADQPFIYYQLASLVHLPRQNVWTSVLFLRLFSTINTFGQWIILFQEVFHLKPREFVGCKRKQAKQNLWCSESKFHKKCVCVCVVVVFWLNACFERLLFTQKNLSTSFPTILNSFGTREKKQRKLAKLANEIKICFVPSVCKYLVRPLGVK